MRKLSVKILFALLISAISAQAAFGQKTVSAQKKRLVSQLVEKTYGIYPAKVLNGAIEETKGEMSAMFKNQISQMIMTKIEAREDLPAEKKEAAKNKIPALSEKFAARLDVLIKQDYQPEEWVKDSLRKNYTQRLSLLDLKKINRFLDTSSGKDFIEMIKNEVAADSESENAKADKDKIESSPAFIKFANSASANKFLDSFLGNTSEILSQKVEAWSKSVLKKMGADFKTGELKRLVTEFDRENLN